MYALLADDGIFRGNFDIADALLIIAAIAFAIAAVLPFAVSRRRTSDGAHVTTVAVDLGSVLVRAGLALTALALALW